MRFVPPAGDDFHECGAGLPESPAAACSASGIVAKVIPDVSKVDGWCG